MAFLSVCANQVSRVVFVVETHPSPLLAVRHCPVAPFRDAAGLYFIYELHPGKMLAFFSTEEEKVIWKNV
ncbi:hypothetical protein C0J52_11601 [Blattella germanica]|nr:hypothetical protein C0J52_11601 [Blattella germanica]